MSNNEKVAEKKALPDKLSELIQAAVRGAQDLQDDALYNMNFTTPQFPMAGGFQQESKYADSFCPFLHGLYQSGYALDDNWIDGECFVFGETAGKLFALYSASEGRIDRALAYLRHWREIIAPSGETDIMRDKAAREERVDRLIQPALDQLQASGGYHAVNIAAKWHCYPPAHSRYRDWDEFNAHCGSLLGMAVQLRSVGE